MSKKPIHEELEQCVKELKEKALQIEQAEAAVRESEERYRRITEAVTDYVFSVRLDNGDTVETVHGPLGPFFSQLIGGRAIINNSH